MCGRYHRTRADVSFLKDIYGVDDLEDLPPEVRIEYNVAPNSFQPIIRLGRDTGRRELAVARWGLVPYWSKDGRPSFSTIIARAETITTSPAFREAVKRRRCLVPATGFYEWQKIDAKSKQPYSIGLKSGEPMAFAGVWERWTDKIAGSWLETYSVITTEPNELMKPIHDRMPVILQRPDYERWLAPADPGQLPVDLLRPLDADLMTAWRVGPEVGNVRNNAPELLRPLE